MNEMMKRRTPGEVKAYYEGVRIAMTLVGGALELGGEQEAHKVILSDEVLDAMEEEALKLATEEK